MHGDLFTSSREKRLWTWALIVVLAIYSTLGLAGRLADNLADRNVLDGVFFAGFIAVIAVIAASGLIRRPGWRELWVLAGAAVVYGLVVVRMGIGAEERTHLFEYGVVGVLIYQALVERSRNDSRVPAPALLAIVITSVLGLADETIQAVLPNRYYDIRDVGFNALAGFLAVATSMVLTRVQRRRDDDIPS